MTLSKVALLFKESVGEKIGVSRTLAEKVVDCIIQVLDKDDRINLPGFGVFTIRRQEARIATNPGTGEKVNVSAKRVVKFKASQKFKDFLNRDLVDK